MENKAIASDSRLPCDRRWRVMLCRSVRQSRREKTVKRL